MSTATTSAEQREPRSLKATYRAAERLRESIERGAFHPGGSALPASGGRHDSVGTPTSYGDAVREALAAYVECSRRVDQLALFSSNESVEDISTAHLPYLLLPYRMAELKLKLPTAQPGPTERRAVLQDAREAYERFLHHLDGYGLLTAPYAKLLAQYTEDPIHFSTLGPVGSSGGSGGGIGSGVAGLADPAARRNAKIAAFRAEKELRSKLEVLRQRQDQRRELARRRKLRMREHENDAADNNTTGEDGEQTSSSQRAPAEEDDDEDEDAEEDDEEARKLHLAAIFYSAHMAFQGLDGINVEDDILAKAPVSLMSGLNATAGGLGDNRQRQADGEADSEAGGDLTRIDDMYKMGNAPILRRLQSALGTAPTWSGNGPLLTKEGKPKQPFTILGSRAEMARNVFRPGHNLPTMSIDEYLEEERKRGGIIEGGGPSSGIPPVPDEDNYEKADAETMKQRAWDEFVEANPKGAGNTLNRG
ncbi:Type 2A phosphatase-associated protein 42 [Sporothrix bragantina]|uniref:Type 2A phosphatase-associated protein 42 n=1 Tax=Sporothrix bragantina TaxID=671064 RepID=A0ABP0CMW3_9PEZI